jgi:hypothetical protein
MTRQDHDLPDVRDASDAGACGNQVGSQATSNVTVTNPKASDRVKDRCRQSPPRTSTAPL